ncbi:glycosyltransferase family 2 protein [Exiguobacterium sp. SL-10]|nr:glycosyltransferase family 2 protein [Exiguobacterium sp. SL-10]
MMMNESKHDLRRSLHRPFGVSVILPAYQSREHISNMLTSLSSQTLDSTLFEVILVVNGPDDGTCEIARAYETLPLRLLYSPVASASHARNTGMSKASFQFLTFVDADDTLSPTYLEDLLNHASLLGITIAHLTDVLPNGAIHESPIEQDIRSVEAGERPSFDVALSRLHRVLTMTTCKLIPTEAAQTVAFKHHLRSAEDVVYFSTLFAHRSFQIRIAPTRAVYFRHRRQHSLSRQQPTYLFAVTDRLTVIQELYSLLSSSRGALTTMLRKKISAQWNILLRYAETNSYEKHHILRDMSRLSVPLSEQDAYHQLMYSVQSIDGEVE